jgi:hypothetical protein
MTLRTGLTRPAALIAALSLCALLALVVACGGDDDGNGGGASNDEPITEEEAGEVANEFLTTTLNLFTGDTSAEEFINLFAPECRGSADIASLELVLAFVQSFAPELQDIEIEEVDAGPLTLEQTPEGTLVTPQDPEALRIKVDGEFVRATDFFAEAGFEATDSETISDSVLLVRRDGNIYLGDCSQLEEILGGLQGRLESPAGPGLHS